MNTNDNSYYQDILNAIPLMIFVVDDDVRVLELNDAAAAVFGSDKAAVFNRRGGEVLHCLHAHDVPEGCGRGPLCQECLIRNSVTESLQGQAVMRRRAKVEWLRGENKKELELLITACPMPDGGGRRALLVLEDISEITTLQGIIPICVKCKKIRDDKQYWQSVEQYFNEYIGVNFTHGVCPTCLDELSPGLSRKMEEKKE